MHALQFVIVLGISMPILLNAAGLNCKQRVAKIKNILKSIKNVERDCDAEFDLPCDCEPPTVESAVWTTYVRWGRTVCPATNGATVLYKGIAAGSEHLHTGGGSNYLCLPDDPEWQTYVDGVAVAGAYIHGAEYQFYKDNKHHVPFSGANAPGGDPHALHDQDVPCVVCQIPRNTVMIPAKRTCPSGWTSEFNGYLVAEHYSHPSNKEFVCMDDAPEALTGGHENRNGALFYSVQSVCGSLPCPKYVNGRELTCVVCSK
ncbi:unnamed protein product [Owenia fusiformis]|uniref:Short-chain collagen C4-like n=1 Tax=Owenia fusiformis TaxID=6347 RepID=A0A8S4PHF8_OWEFU|nr:unnamed protein product [Owenia fusiformis]